MKRIALFLGLTAAFVSAATAGQFGSGKPDRIFVSVQVNGLPVSSLTIADGGTGTVYVESDLPYVEQMEKARRVGDAVPSSESEGGVTMLLTPTLTADGKIDVEFSIRESGHLKTNADSPRTAATEVRHKLAVKNGQKSTIQVDPAPAQNESLLTAEPGTRYTVTLVAQKI